MAFVCRKGQLGAVQGPLAALMGLAYVYIAELLQGT